jgi:hypothetical protein
MSSYTNRDVKLKVGDELELHDVSLDFYDDWEVLGVGNELILIRDLKQPEIEKAISLDDPDYKIVGYNGTRLDK